MKRAWLILGAAFAAIVVSVQPAMASVSTSNVTAQFFAAHSEKCLDVDGGSGADLTRIIQFRCIRQHPAQTFELRPAGVFDGFRHYLLVAQHSGKCLDVFRGGTTDGTPIIQFTCVPDSPAQQFRLVPLGTGFSHIVARHSGKCLQPSGQSTADLIPIVQATCSAVVGAQHWGLAWVS